MIRKIKHLTVVCLGAAILGNTGCSKLIEIKPPLNETSAALVFQSDATARAALSGMYNTFSQSATQNTSLTVNNTLLADDVVYLGANTSARELAANSYTVLSTISTDPFNTWYNIIYQANAIIIGMQNNTAISAQTNRQLTAEAKLMRAYCYFSLVNIFGDIPLVLTTDATISAYQPKETAANVYQQIIRDLTDAKANLLDNYAVTGQDRIGVNRFTAAALLARVYLFTGRYAEAASNASEVIASNLYSLTPQANIGTALFVKNSAESIWQLPPPINPTFQYTNEAGAFIPTSYTQDNIFYRIRPEFTQLFASTDLRRTRWMNDAIINGATYSVPFKYKYRTQALAVAAGVTEYQVILRLAEQYLIRAEARARLGTDLAGALSDLNTIRTRAGAVTTNTSVQAALLDEIALENRKEFFCEQAFRWNNLRRTGQADAVLNALKSTYRPTSKLFPIPQVALDTNPNLTQTPGY
ncbi:RagB/SusD family nutrient uptake outer membrane protein [Mucilaginibacter terrae]|uniref:RagB/SusD family nutrient uptake outer membrane protein n=1 Tax=Mucilaginibacter terrae TaxID=1955052 RepID=A0ABU3GZZ1_9SPHI|nr:RagB/SusD family nutrient uptake outer membrane protein [Mucilaginibacter terrae]MDT3405338.1 hypothetical protein [Mucilaginibacter terrae]